LTTSGLGQQNSKFQIAKLKGFSCVHNESSLQPIWNYFHSIKEVDSQCMHLLEEMRQCAGQNDIQINRSIYFNKATMDDITILEFGPGTPMAYLSTVKQGILILVCRP
jgi:hypothetical protein